MPENEQKFSPDGSHDQLQVTEEARQKVTEALQNDFNAETVPSPIDPILDKEQDADGLRFTHKQRKVANELLEKMIDAPAVPEPTKQQVDTKELVDEDTRKEIINVLEDEYNMDSYDPEKGVMVPADAHMEELQAPKPPNEQADK